LQLINHGVNTSLIEKVKVGIKEFLSLPVEEKKKFWQTPNDMEGFGQMFVVSDDQKLEWADLFLITTLPLDERNPRLFPSIFQPFRFFSTLSSYFYSTRNTNTNTNTDKFF
jgi:isopenicillin N synthase-like dioxygenase